jgi:acyl-CoA thioester hydrolase
MAYYLVAFDKATDVLLEQLGLAWDYTQHELGMIFVVEAHITYARELCEGDPIRVTTQIVDHNAKLMHVFHSMYHGALGYGVATNELLMLHVDFRSRRSSPWPDASTQRLEALAAAHLALPPPPGLGPRISIRRS